MKKNKKISLIISLVVTTLLIVSGSYAYWTWNSNTNKNIVFNTSKGLEDYIIYDEGESKFVGDFKVSDTFLEGVHTTISIHKTSEASNVSLYATINMDINAIGTNIRNNSGLKWVVTEGDSSVNNPTILSRGNFLGVNANDTLELYNNIEVLTQEQEFTIWLWLDSSVNLPEELSGETIDTSIWTQIDQVVADRFEITRLSTFGDMISATAVNSTANITHYQVTTSNTTPTNWIAIPSSDIGNIYTLEHNTQNNGLNYVWFKDSNNNVISDSVNVSLVFAITYKDVGNTPFSGTHGNNYPVEYTVNNSVSLDTPTKAGYVFQGYYLNSDGTGTPVTEIGDNQVGNITLYAKWADNIAPTATISSTSNPKAASQAITLSCNDNIGVTSYYYGTSAPTSSSTYMPVTSTTGFSHTDTISSANTYYLACKDEAGNVSTTASKTYYKYTVKNMYQNLTGSTYTTTDYTQASSQDYIAPSGTSLAIASIYTIPTGSSAERISYYSVGAPSTTGAATIAKATNPTLSANNTIYAMWFPRNLIYIKFKPNGGTVASPTQNAAGTEIYTFTLDGNGYISRSTNGGTATTNLRSYRYGTTSIDLPNYNSSAYLKITKIGYGATTNQEWICESGCTTSNKVFSQSAMTFSSSNDMCNASTSNCTIVLKVNWVDNVGPEVTPLLKLQNATFTLSINNYSDPAGMSSTYGYSLSTSSTCNSSTTFTNSTNTSVTYTENGTPTLVNGSKYYGCVKLTDNLGNISYKRTEGIIFAKQISTFAYTGTQQTYTPPVTGNYKLEVWGASSGYSSSANVIGYGAYATGIINLTLGQTLYINVGQEGTYSTGKTFTVPGTYNGGGSGAGYNVSMGRSSGGGATHIATSSGLLASLETKIDDILIVAGGGGGGGYYSASETGKGGDAGGIIGSPGTVSAGDGYDSIGTGGSQSSGGTGGNPGSFGQGANHKIDTSKWHGNGGGGGFYGGGSGVNNAGGGGGSSYIGNTELSNKAMYCYNCTESLTSPGTSNTFTINTNGTSNISGYERNTAECSAGYSSNAISKCAKSGAGYAKVTLLNYNVIYNLLTYNNQNGAGCSSKAVLAGGQYGTLCTPVRNGYLFDGWYTSATGGTLITNTTTVTNTSNHTIYAHWVEIANLSITFNPNGNSSYASSISSAINVTKGTYNLNTSSFKYIISKDINATPSTTFTNNQTVSFSSGEGMHYIIVKACDSNGNCNKKISSPFRIDTVAPTASLSLSINASKEVVASVTASDGGSGLATTPYAYKISTSRTCNSSTTGFTNSGNASYTFSSPYQGVNYVCVKVTDKMGNAKYVSNSITTEILYDYISSNYQCNTAATNLALNYTGNCTLVNDGSGNWRIKFLTSGTLRLTEDFNLDVFLVGGGGGGAQNATGSSGYYIAGANGGGGGGYTKTSTIEPTKNTSHTITIGAGGTGGTSTTNGGNTTALGFTAGGGHGGTYQYESYHDQYYMYLGGGGGGDGGSGGGTGRAASLDIRAGGVDGADGDYSGGKGQISQAGPNGETGSTREFGEASGALYSTGGNAGGALTNGTANTGNGGSNGGSGGSGIVIIRNHR